MIPQLMPRGLYCLSQFWLRLFEIFEAGLYTLEGGWQFIVNFDDDCVIIFAYGFELRLDDGEADVILSWSQWIPSGLIRQIAF